MAAARGSIKVMCQNFRLLFTAGLGGRKLSEESGDHVGGEGTKGFEELVGFGGAGLADDGGEGAGEAVGEVESEAVFSEVKVEGGGASFSPPAELTTVGGEADLVEGTAFEVSGEKFFAGLGIPEGEASFEIDGGQKSAQG